MTVPDPTVLQNGYVDTKASNDHMFYRVYILLDSGKFKFSVSKRPRLDTSKTGDLPLLLPRETKGDETLNNTNVLERMIYIKKRDSVIGVIPERSLRTYRDYLLSNTKDTVIMKSPDTLVIRPFVPREFYRPSKFVFTEKDGNVKINLADAASKKYIVKFFEEDNTEIFEINHIKDSVMVLDKTNFYHSGWFNFELYEDGKLKEKHRLFVPKDF